MASKTKLMSLLLLISVALTQQTLATSYEWNGGSGSDWNTSTNWTPNGVPSTGDDVTITNVGTSPVLDMTRTIGTLIITSGTLDLGGFTLNISTTGTFTSGTINNGTVNASSATTVTFAGTSFGASISGSSASVHFNGGTFDGAVAMTKTGSFNCNGTGGCTFNNTAAFTHNGTGEWYMAQNNPDIFNSTATYTNTSTSRIYCSFGATGNHYVGKSFFKNTSTGAIYIGHTGGSTRFGDDVEFENTSTGIIRVGTGNASVTIDAGKNILIGSNGFISGDLQLNNFTPGGTSARSLTLTGSASLTLGASSVYDMEVTITAPSIHLTGVTFNKEAKFVKNGSNQNASNSGGCLFKDSTTFVHNGTGEWYFAQSSPDTFNTSVTYLNTSTSKIYASLGATGNYYKGKAYFRNSSSGDIFIGHTGGSTRFGDDVELENTSTGTIRMGTSNASITMDAGKEIVLGSGGFASGDLQLNNFTPGGTIAKTLTLTGSAELTLGPKSVYDMEVTFTAASIHLGGGTFNKEAKFVKTGSPQNGSSSGGCIFNDSTTFVHNGTGEWYFAQTNPDTFNFPVTYMNTSTSRIYCSLSASGNYYKSKSYFKNTGTGDIYIGHTGGSTRFGDDVELENTSSGTIRIGTTSASITIDSGKELLIGSNGFGSGTLSITNFTPGGSAARSLTLTGTAILSLGTLSVYNMDITFSAPGLVLSGGTYNGTSQFTKTGALQNLGAGGCTYNGATTITNDGSGALVLENNNASDYNGDVTYVRNNGTIYNAHVGNVTYAKGVTVTNPSNIFFGNGGGTVTLDGATAQAIGGNAEVTIKELTIANSSSTGLTLNTPVKVTTSLTLTDGHIFTTSSNLLSIADGATSSSGSAASYVDGPMKKIGDEDFVFPLGDENIWARLGIAGAGGSNTDEFTAQYLKLDYPDLTVTGSLTNVSYAEYWTLSRDNGTSSKTVQLFWEDHNESRIANPASTNLRVAHYNGTDWEDAGHTALSSGTSGSVTSASVSSFSPFTFGSFDQVENPLPVELLSFTGYKEGQQVALQWETATEINNDFFTLERSSNGRDGYEPIARIQGQGTTYDITSYQYTDTRPLSGSNFYRLKQTDYDGSYTYSNPVQVTFNGRVTDDLPIITQLYPNPASDQLTITLNYDRSLGPITINVIDMLGQQIFSKTYQTSTEAKVQLEQIPAGAYLLNVQIPSGRAHSQRFIKKN